MDKIFSTTDVYLAAFLALEGFPILDTKRKLRSAQCEFSFTETEKIKGKINNYWSHETKVDPIAYIGKVHELKFRIKTVLNSTAKPYETF